MLSVIRTIDEALAQVVRVTRDAAGAHGQLTFPPLFQGFPEAAHGGGLLAAFDRVARACVPELGVPRHLAAKILRGLPLETSLPLDASRRDTSVRLTLSRGAKSLAEATVEMGSRTGDGSSFSAWTERRGTHWVAPTTRGCLACGSENPLGCRLHLAFDDRWLWCEHRPRDPFRLPDGSLDVALFPIILDEIGWWLGALRTGEAGVTAEVAVTIHRHDVAFGDPLVLLGDYSTVTSADGKGHFWRTEGGVFDAHGTLLASARVTYAASRIYSKRLIPALLALNPAESVRRVFPTYVAELRDRGAGPQSKCDMRDC